MLDIENKNGIYPWQQKQWEKILTYLQKKRMPHALLLSGSRGLGKLMFAKSVAELVLCECNETQACGRCRDCQLFRSGNHPDFFTVDLKEGGHAVKVTQIRELAAALNQTAQRNHYQVAILSSAELMNRSAANAFLKTLEEPLGTILLMLVTHRPRILPQTVLSRCQRIEFRTCADPKILQWVKKQIKNKSKASQLLSLAYNSPLKAIKLERLNYFSLRNRLLKLLVTATQNESAIDIVNILLKEDAKLVLYITTILLMDILRFQINCSDFILNTDCLPILQKFSSVLSQENLLEVLRQLQETWQVIAGSVKINFQLLLEEIFLILFRGKKNAG
ncbi:DNA polymerase III subunit delta' [Coxiella endosymbiont of Amblyomma sculptum]|uniref:DNA polymerase III subunit delta' n=1 Tax=Coxiella endosymbiont of Amblyomma sculptum TaxID=2487929 RepID=UPI00132F2BD6|nr:DNA polymerase III subunit delta' [Coxiella endosymbiont of Amblyomma sculptum]QHG92639.1 DNA polymerase III subunit delta' [Coxiella endosymbiont of Amblyomma sculptum]